MVGKTGGESNAESPLEGLSSMQGTALVQRQGVDVLRHARGTTGGSPDAEIGFKTRFQLASVSKQFTATAIMLLVDRGALSVDDRLVDVLDGCPAKWRDITIHQLLCHTSGIVHWPQLPELDLTAEVPVDKLLAIFGDAPLLAEPGARYAYSSPGYVLLAHVVERLGGRPYRAFLSDEIFSPLGMDMTFAGNAGRAGGAGDLATPLHLGQRVASYELDVVGMGAGDVWSTIPDLVTWDDASAKGLVMSDASRQAMITPHSVPDEELGGVTIQGYGYAWYLADVGGHRVVFHTGGNAGFQSINALLPDDDARFILLTNDTSTDLFGISFELLLVAVGDDSS